MLQVDQPRQLLGLWLPPPDWSKGAGGADGAWGHWGCYYSGLRHIPGTCRRPASVSLTPSARVPTRVPFLSCVCLSVPCPSWVRLSISQAWDPSIWSRDSLFSVPFSAEPLASVSLPDPGQNLSCSVALTVSHSRSCLVLQRVRAVGLLTAPEPRRGGAPDTRGSGPIAASGGRKDWRTSVLTNREGLREPGLSPPACPTAAASAERPTRCWFQRL